MKVSPFIKILVPLCRELRVVRKAINLQKRWSPCVADERFYHFDKTVRRMLSYHFTEHRIERMQEALLAEYKGVPLISQLEEKAISIAELCSWDEEIFLSVVAATQPRLDP